MTEAIKILKNNNIRLIPIKEEHEHVFIEFANIPEINERVNKPFPYTDKHFSEHLASVRKANSHFVWMIEQDGEFAGVINSAAGRHPQLFQGGYWVRPDKWRKGAASTSLILVKNFLLNECKAQRIQAVVEPDNVASIRVLEKCGYKHEGLLKKFYPSRNRGLIDVNMYAVIAAQ